MQEPITILAHEMDGLGKKIFDLGNALTNKIGQLTESSRPCEVLEVSLPSQRNLTASINVLINGITTNAVIDTAAMVTLVRDNYLAPLYGSSQLGPVCVLTGIGADPVSGRIVHNVPITVGT